MDRYYSTYAPNCLELFIEAFWLQVIQTVWGIQYKEIIRFELSEMNSFWADSIFLYIKLNEHVALLSPKGRRVSAAALEIMVSYLQTVPKGRRVSRIAIRPWFTTMKIRIIAFFSVGWA